MVERRGGMRTTLREDHSTNGLERLTAAVEALTAEQAVLAGLVRQLVEREAPQRWMRTGAVCKLLGIHRASLYALERTKAIARSYDAVGEVVWDREEVLRARAGQVVLRRHAGAPARR